METIKDYRSHIPRKDGGVGKAILFQSARLLLGLNCLEPGVEQRNVGVRSPLSATQV